MAEEEQKKDSSAVGKINSLAGKGRDAQRLYNAYKKARLAVAAGEGLSSLAAGVPIIIIALILIVIIIIFSGAAPAPVTGTDLTNSPSPSGNSSPGPSTSPGPSSNTLTSWAKQISTYVQTYPSPCNTPTGPIYIYNVMQQAVTNGSYTAHKKPGSACGIAASSYYCSDLIIDSYNLSGIKVGFWEGVKDMIAGWPSVTGLSVGKANDVNGLQPGDVIFWLYSNLTAAHVDMIYAMSVGSSGNGTITTIDANTNSKFNTFYVRNWAIIGTWRDGANVPWFGLGPR